MSAAETAPAAPAARATRSKRTHRCSGEGHAHAETTTCYVVHGCGCDDCVIGMRERDAHRRKQIAYGRHREQFVDGDTVREWLREWLDAGATQVAIQRQTGVQVWPILHGQFVRGRSGRVPVRRVRVETARKLLAFDLDAVEPLPSALVDGRGVRRRVRALVALGYSMRGLGDRLGVRRQQIQELAGAEQVQYKTHAMIARLYEELSMRPPEPATATERAICRKARGLARERGWAPPLAWDDIDLDEAPHTTGAGGGDWIDTIAIDIVCGAEPAPDAARWLTKQERVIAVRRLHAAGVPDTQIGTRLGVDSRLIWQIRQDLGLPAVTNLTERKAA